MGAGEKNLRVRTCSERYVIKNGAASSHTFRAFSALCNPKPISANIIKLPPVPLSSLEIGPAEQNSPLQNKIS